MVIFLKNGIPEYRNSGIPKVEDTKDVKKRIKIKKNGRIFAYMREKQYLCGQN